MGLDASLGLCENAAAIDLGADRAFSEPSIVYVGTAGNVKIDTDSQTAITIKAPAGVALPFLVRKVYSTSNGTTAADLVRGW